jgi:hypothetical protein
MAGRQEAAPEGHHAEHCCQGGHIKDDEVQDDCRQASRQAGRVQGATRNKAEGAVRKCIEACEFC